MCIECSNGYETTRIDNWRITQLPVIVEELSPIPQLAPYFLSPLETVSVAYLVGSSLPYDPVNYMLPEAFDYNFDPISVEFNPLTWEPWAHILEFDGDSKVTVLPGSLTDSDLVVLEDASTIDIKLTVIDSTGLVSPVYTL